MNTCATCRFWESWPTFPDGYGACALAEHDSKESVHPESKALAFGMANDWGEKDAYLFTAPDFGCIQYSPKDTAS